MGLFDFLKYIRKSKKKKVKAEKRPLESLSILEKKSYAPEVSSSKALQINEISPIEGSIPPAKTTVEEESTPEDELFIEKEPTKRADKPVLFVKKVIPKFTLNPQTHTLGLLNKVELKNSGAASELKVKGSIKYRLKDKILANEPIASNVTLGPHQSIILENSFNLPLSEIQYIKIANIIKNKQKLEVKDVKPIMKVDIQYERENGEVSDIVQSYQFDFKENSWGLYIKEAE